MSEAIAAEYATFTLDGYRNPVAGVRYAAGEPASAVPLGALGTGAIDLCSDGHFRGSTLQYDVRPSGDFPRSFLAVRTVHARRSEARVLQVSPAFGLPGVTTGTYLGHYPVVDLWPEDESLPVEVHVQALAPLIPRNSADSGLPCALLRVRLTNRTAETVQGRVALSWENDIPLVGQARGNVGGFLTWAKDELKPGESFPVPFVMAKVSETPAREVADAHQFVTSQRPMPAMAPWPADAQQVALAGADVKAFYVDRAGGFNWEAERKEAFRLDDEGNIGQMYYWLRYDRDGEQSAGLTHAAGGYSGLSHLRVTEVGLSGDHSQALNRLTTDDGALEVQVRTTVGPGAFVVREYTVTNVSATPVRHIEVSHYVNFDVGGPPGAEANSGAYDAATDALVVKGAGDAAFALFGLGRPAKFDVTAWHASYERMCAGGGQVPLAEGAGPPARRSFQLAQGGIGLAAGAEAEGYALRVTGPSSAAARQEATAWDDPAAFWQAFADGKPLAPGTGEPAAGVVAAPVTVPPGRHTDVDFALAWYFPHLRDSDGNEVGRHYATRFASAEEVLDYATQHRERLRRETIAWQDELYGADVPAWLKDACVNGLYSLARNTWWIADGRFAHSESFTGCPIMETIVCRFNGAWPIALFWPHLEQNTLSQFARFQNEQGAIPFAFGPGERMDSPYYETQKSLDTSEWLLMVYRHLHWNPDPEYLGEVYPHVKRAVRYAETLDTDGDHLINEVSMQYYDVWQFHGTSCYVASIWLAGLKAAERMAHGAGDFAFAGECREWFEAGRASFGRKLWNGSYYRLYNEPETGQVSEVCLGNQLAGQWFAYAVGLGELLPREHIVSAIDSVLRLNGASTPYGVANGCNPDGTRPAGAHSDCISPGETFNFAATAIHAGRADEGLEQAREACSNVALLQKTPWNICFNFSAADGRMIWGQNYYSNMGIWTVLMALADVRADGNGLHVTLP
jgi:uncharacterized protein (DUF608 family)